MKNNVLKLQKAIQAAGFDSRRNIRKWIHDGEIKVNNTPVTDPNFQVDITRDTIRFRDKKLKLQIEHKAYYLLNKPIGVISSLDDPQGRATVVNFLAGIKERVYPVGRLDYNSEGLMLLTNDGELTNYIISPRNLIPKVYLVKIKGVLKDEERRKLLSRGMHVEGIRVKPVSLEYVRKTAKMNSWIRVTIVEGKKHVIRKMFQFMGHPVDKLRRVAIGTFKLGQLPRGHTRKVKPEELEEFKKRFGYKEKEE